jgi:hypothetical protein
MVFPLAIDGPFGYTHLEIEGIVIILFQTLLPAGLQAIAEYCI